MSTIRRRYAAPIAIAMALAITPALSGCFGNPIEQIVEGATGGNVDLGGTSVPDGYPTNEVPLIQGEIVSGISLGNATDGQVFNVVVKVSGPEAADQIKSQLEGAGLTAQADLGGTSADGTTLVYSSDKWGVLVVIVSDSSNGFVANYTVTPATQN
jgi:hypothetical protein